MPQSLWTSPEGITGRTVNTIIRSYGKRVCRCSNVSKRNDVNLWQRPQGRRSHGLHHYRYGENARVAADMALRLEEVSPGLAVEGTGCPLYRDLTDELSDLCTSAADCAAKVFSVELVTPRQDYRVHRLADRLEIPVITVGATFDLWVGRVREAPRLLQGPKLRLTHRLIKEPRRLWRRCFVGNTRFLISAYRHSGHRRERCVG
jgi:N-acetylglucosaminyldiphosphoundecaprenol N-acetyl-beta-D-mannosaminyltransferase